MRKKSGVPIIIDPVDGPNIDMHEAIIYETEDGKVYEGVCLGWARHGEKVVIKTSGMTSFGRLDLPVDKVWRVYNAKDEYIDKIKAELEACQRLLRVD